MGEREEEGFVDFVRLLYFYLHMTLSAASTQPKQLMQAAGCVHVHFESGTIRCRAHVLTVVFLARLIDRYFGPAFIVRLLTTISCIKLLNRSLGVSSVPEQLSLDPICSGSCKSQRVFIALESCFAFISNTVLVDCRVYAKRGG